MCCSFLCLVQNHMNYETTLWHVCAQTCAHFYVWDILENQHLVQKNVHPFLKNKLKCTPLFFVKHKTLHHFVLN